MISASITGAFAIAAFFTSSSNKNLNYFLDPWLLVDVVLIVVLVVFFFRKSRVAATLMVIYFTGSKLLMWAEMGEPKGLLMAIIFLLFYVTSMRGKYIWHSKYRNVPIKTTAPYVVRCDPGRYPRIPIRVEAKARGGLFGRTIASNYTHYPSECGRFNKDKILLLFCGPLEPWLESAGQPYWTTEQFSVAYNFAVCAMDHVFHFGLIPKFVGKFNFTTALVAPYPDGPVGTRIHPAQTG